MMMMMMMRDSDDDDDDDEGFWGTLRNRLSYEYDSSSWPDEKVGRGVPLHPGCCEEERPGLAGGLLLLESCHAKPNVNSSIKQYIFMFSQLWINVADKNQKGLDTGIVFPQTGQKEHGMTHM